MTTSSTNVDPGDFVTFNVEIFQQGDTATLSGTSGFQAIDYINLSMWEPFDLAMNGPDSVMTVPDPTPPPLNPNPGPPVAVSYAWSAGPNPTLTITSGVVPPSHSFVVPITLQVLPSPAFLPDNGDCGPGTRWIANYAEISGDQVPGNDQDSVADSVNGNDLLTDGPPGDGVTFPDPITNPDEDDHDVACVNVTMTPPPTYDLAVNLLCTQEDEGAEDVPVFRTVTTLINQGGLPATNVQIIDYFDSAFFQPFSAGQNPNGTTGGSVALPYAWAAGPGGTGIVTINGTLAPGDFVTVPSVLTLAVPVQPTTDATVEIYLDDGMDFDSIPESEEGNGPADASPNDDLETVGCVVADYDLALRKTVAPTQSTDVNAGDLVEFVIEVCNQGTNPAGTGVQVRDYVDLSMWEAFNVTDNGPGTGVSPAADCGTLPATVPTFSWATDGSDGIATIAGDLAAGEGVAFPVFLTVAAGAVPPFLNYAEIEVDFGIDMDSDPESQEMNGNSDDLVDDSIGGLPPPDEDDHDVARITPSIYAIPTVSDFGLVLLGLALLWIAFSVTRRRNQEQSPTS